MRLLELLRTVGFVTHEPDAPVHPAVCPGSLIPLEVTTALMQAFAFCRVDDPDLRAVVAAYVRLSERRPLSHDLYRALIRVVLYGDWGRRPPPLSTRLPWDGTAHCVAVARWALAQAGDRGN
jgi:hypothetical protein